MCACATGPRPPPAPPRHTSLGLSISSHTLANGLRVVVVKDPHASEVEVTMRYQVGSVDDPAAHPGMAHLVEHLMFQQVLGSQTLFAHLENITTLFNGVTTADATTYYSRAQPAHLDELLSIEAVRMGFRCTSITPSAFEREREVVVNELALKDDAFAMLGALHTAAYPAGHPYRESSASVEAVRSTQLDQACAFADAHYAPGNAVLVISGNVDEQRVGAALARFLARVARRAVTAPTPVAAVPAEPRQLSSPAPLDRDALMIAWPLPVDPRERLQVNAFAWVAAAAIDAELKGQIATLELGDERAPMLAFVIEPATNESIDDARAAAKRGLASLRDAFTRSGIESLDELTFDRIQQQAIYGQYSGLEDAVTRDIKLATYVHAGLDPAQALELEFRALRALSPAQGKALAETYFNFDHATVAKLEATGKRRGHAIAIGAPIHDQGMRRGAIDPADAHRAASGPAAPTVAIESRVLANGLKVLLLPVSSVPTVDIRLVFGAGTADEPIDKRGAAIAAARALTWDWHYLNDLLRFIAAGGMADVDVGTDHTTFRVRGVDMHLDLLLAGLRRWIREGRYSDGDEVLRAIRRAHTKGNDEGALADAWREAQFGARHPYVRAGVARLASEGLTTDDAAQFRSGYFTPDNATIVIVGHFDATLADRWIDYLFADWQGHAQPRTTIAAAPHPASLAKIDDLAQVELQVALPARAASRAHRLIASEMLAEVADDVRHELGATYGLRASLAESRLASQYLVTGWIAAGHARAALELVRDRIAALRTNSEAAARAFVLARARAIVWLESVADLGGRVQRDLDLARAPLADLDLVAAARAVTIEDMAPALAELDLSRAIVMVRGPENDVNDAFGALGRKPQLIAASTTGLADPFGEDEPLSARKHEAIDASNLADPITEQPVTHLIAFAATAAYGLGNIVEPDIDVTLNAATGLIVTTELGYRFTRASSVGLHLAGGILTGTYAIALDTTAHHYGVVPIDIDAYASTTALDRIWGGALIGAHIDAVTKQDTKWFSGVGIGFEGGIDLLRRGSHRLGLAARVGGVLGSASGFGGLSLGVAYRR